MSGSAITPTRRRTAFEVAATGFVSLACSLIVFLPALQIITVPWGGSDMTQYYYAAQTWEWWRQGFTSNFGFPDGVDTNIYSGLDILTSDFAHAVGLLTGNPFVGLNLLLFLSFPLVAMLAYVAIRLVGLSGPLAVALANAFTFIPYHFGRGIGHLHLATLIGGVSGIVLVLLVGSGRMQWWMTQARGRTRGGYIAVTVLLVGLSSWTGLYYAAFTAIFLAAAVVWRIAQGDTWRRLLLGATPLFGVFALAAIGMLPVALSRSAAVGASAVGIRDPMDSVKYAGNLAIALVPEPYNVFVTGYNDFVFNLFKDAPPDEPNLMSNYGTWITTTALVVMLVGMVLRFRRLHATPANPVEQSSPDITSPPQASITFVAYLIVVLVPLFMPWGLNFFSANFITSQIRGWNRLVPILLLFFILGAAATLAHTRWSHKMKVVLPLAAFLVVVTVLEMVLPWRNLYSVVPGWGRDKIAAAYAYADSVNKAIPGRCGVLTLPLMLYPNNGPVMPNMDDYDHLLIGMTNPDKPISYGAIRDTPASAWQLDYTGAPTPDQVAALKQKGFCAIHLDTAGFQDPATIEQQLTDRLGPPVAVDPTGRWKMFELP